VGLNPADDVTEGTRLRNLAAVETVRLEGNGWIAGVEFGFRQQIQVVLDFVLDQELDVFGEGVVATDGNVLKPFLLSSTFRKNVLT
jgi:hypothetical protein